jgi:NADH dehydrogenase
MRELTKIIVTGASGFVGTAVLHELRQGFYPVLAIMRPGSDAQNACRLGCLIYRADVHDKDGMRHAFANGADAVIHLVGIIEEHGTDTFHHVHVEGTRAVVELAQEFQLKKLVHMSALGTRPNAAATYHKTKWEAEEIVRTSGLPFSILRPSVIFGEGSEFLSTLEMIARMLLVTPIIGDGRGRLQPVYVRDVARVLRLCLEDEKTDGQTYEMGGPETFSIDEMLSLMERRLGKSKTHVYLPLGFGEFVASTYRAPVIGRLLGWFGRNVMPIPRLNHDQLVMMQESNTCDPAPLKAAFPGDLRVFSEWLRSDEYCVRPWRTWKSRWLVPPPGDSSPIQSAGQGSGPGRPQDAA